MTEDTIQEKFHPAMYDSMELGLSEQAAQIQDEHLPNWSDCSNPVLSDTERQTAAATFESAQTSGNVHGLSLSDTFA